MKSMLHAALVVALLAMAMLPAVGCSQQEPTAPAADEPAETATQEPSTEFSAGFETGDTAEWSDEDATDGAEESAAIEDPASEPEAADD